MSENIVDISLIGKRGVMAEMDIPRRLFFSLSAQANVEEFLKTTRIIEPPILFDKAGLPIRNAKGEPLRAPYSAGLAFMPDAMDMAKVFQRVLFEALNGGGAGLKDPAEVDNIYQGFLEKTGDKTDLGDLLYQAFYSATNPRQIERNMKAVLAKRAEENPPDSGNESSESAMTS